jgi:hypothetical protein
MQGDGWMRMLEEDEDVLDVQNGCNRSGRVCVGSTVVSSKKKLGCSSWEVREATWDTVYLLYIVAQSI